MSKRSCFRVPHLRGLQHRRFCDASAALLCGISFRRFCFMFVFSLFVLLYVSYGKDYGTMFGRLSEEPLHFLSAALEGLTTSWRLVFLFLFVFVLGFVVVVLKFFFVVCARL